MYFSLATLSDMTQIEMTLLCSVAQGSQGKHETNSVMAVFGLKNLPM